MAEYDNNLSGVLFRNDRKERDAHPDYKGHAEIDGVEYWLSAWVKTGAKGKFMSLAFTAKEQKPNPPSREQGPSREQVKPARTQQRASDPFDDDVPF